MRVVECAELGPVENLVVTERAEPTAGPGQVVISVEAAGMNYVDALFVQGQYQIKPPVPFVPGSEVAGHITAVGEGVPTERIGQRVLAMCGLGGYAEAVAVPDDTAVPIPDSMSAATAAAFTQSFCTAWFALVERAQLKAGDRVLVLGAGGGVGLAAVDIARALGASVLGVASSPEKQDAARRAGASTVVDSSGNPRDAADRLKQEARAWAGGAGIDIALDPVGGPMAEAALRSLGYAGRLIVIGFAGGDIPPLPANQILLRNRTVLGVDWGAWALSHPAEQRAMLQRLLDGVAASALRPPAPEQRPLAEASTALADLLARRVTGKVVLIP